jgi:hypothetical protein
MGETPETRYAKSGDLHIAYQVLGEGPTCRQTPIALFKGEPAGSPHSD